MTRVLIAAGGLLMVWGSACSSAPGETRGTIEIRGESVLVTELRGVVDALCDAKDAAGQDPEEARMVFFDRAHDPLHDIAAAAGEVNRSSAARLLEAKQAVESDLNRTAGTELASDLGALVAATRDALKQLSVSVPGCDD
jgi:electron transfer flavoprotein alpha subunit